MSVKHILLNGILMSWKQRKNYLLLSVTVVLSFSFLLGFLCYTDTKNYNDTKEIFSMPNNLILVYGETDETSVKKMNVVKQYCEKRKNFFCYEYYEQQIRLLQYGSLVASVNIIPNNIFGYYQDNSTKIELSGSDEISLKENEAVISDELYRILKQSKNNEAVSINIPISLKNGEVYHKRYTINDTYKTNGMDDSLFDSDVGVTGNVTILIPQDSEFVYDLDYDNISLAIWSEDADEVLTLINNLGLAYYSPYEMQKESLETTKNNMNVKFVIALVLFILLGFNLYSSFMNVLTKREYEIGIRRALGAGKTQIILQFFVECFIVMIINILLSVGIVCWLAILYKVTFYWVFDEILVIYISKYSIYSFLVCSLCLSLFFGFIFSLQSTQIEIIKYLKGE